MSSTYQQHLAEAEYLRLNPNADVKRGGLCQKVAHTIAMTPPFGASAIIAWHNIPDQFKRPGQYVEGALNYYDYADRPDNQEFGHATWNAQAGITYSTDILGMGKLWRVDYRLITQKWGMRHLGSAVGTPYGALALPIKPPATPPAYPGVPIGWNSPYHAANLAVQRALNNAGYKTPLTGTYISPQDSTMRVNIEAYANRHTAARDADNLGAGAVGSHLYASLMTYWA